MWMYQALWQSLGMPHQMKNEMTACITWWQKGTPLNKPGTQWLMAFSTTGLQPATSCQGESTSSVSMPKMTWDNLLPQNLQSGSLPRKKVCNFQTVIYWAVNFLYLDIYYLYCLSIKGLGEAAANISWFLVRGVYTLGQVTNSVQKYHRNNYSHSHSHLWQTKSSQFTKSVLTKSNLWDMGGKPECLEETN